MKRVINIVIWILITILVVIGFSAMMINNSVVRSTKEDIVYTIDSDNSRIPEKKVKEIQKFNPDCAIILGAGIKDRETPTPMLKDRLDAGIELYKQGAVKKLLLTGDNGTNEHNEIHVMLKYAIDHGVPSQDVFCDHAGFSTSDSMHRAIKIFDIKKAVIVTQTYHEYRALYIGKKLGMDVIGVASDQRKYSGQPGREVREILARNKDFYKVKFKKDTSLGGEKFPITGDGTKSHGE